MGPTSYFTFNFNLETKKGARTNMKKETGKFLLLLCTNVNFFLSFRELHKSYLPLYRIKSY